MTIKAALDETTVGGRVACIMREYGLGHNQFARLAHRKPGYFSTLFARTAKSPNYRPKEPTIRELAETIEDVARQIKKDPVEHEWLSSGTGPKYKKVRKTFAEYPTYLRGEAVVLASDEGKDIPPVAFWIARHRYPEIDTDAYTARDVLVTVQYHFKQTPEEALKSAGRAMYDEEDRELHKVRHLRPPPTPPPPSRKGPAVRSAHSRKR